jgi:hypothetical protein
MPPDTNLTGAPASPDFQLGVFAERLASLQNGVTRLESTQNQAFGLIKETNQSLNTALLKLENVEQRTKTVEGDVADHAANLVKKADELSISEEIKGIRSDVEDLKKGKWTIVGICSAISAISALLVGVLPLLLHH